MDFIEFDNNYSLAKHFNRNKLALKYESEQYKLSSEIIKFRFSLNKNTKNLSALLNLSHEIYLRLECADRTLSPVLYMQVLEEMKQMIEKL